jgi:hypothetical protein
MVDKLVGGHDRVPLNFGFAEGYTRGQVRAIARLQALFGFAV